MEVDKHIQISLMAGLIEKLHGASNYWNDRPLQAKEITKTLICRAKSREERLDLQKLIQSVPFDRKYEMQMPDTTHVVVGVTYGVEAYWIVALELQENESDAEALSLVSFVSSFATKLSNALKENGNLTMFKEQVLQEEKPELINRLKFRLYADLQSKPVPECGFHQFCIEQIQKTNVETNKVIPISVLLCPWKVIMDPAERFVPNCRDVSSDLVTRYCRVWNKLEDIINEVNIFRMGKRGAAKLSLLQFEKAIKKYKELLRNDMKKGVLKTRDTRHHQDNKEVENVICVAEDHPYFKPSQLEKWLDYKKSELTTLDFITMRGIHSASRNQLENELLLADSFGKEFSLVLNVPSLEEVTHKMLLAIAKYVDTNTKLTPVIGSFDQVPWHWVNHTKVSVLNEILKFENHIEKNKHLNDSIHFFIAFNDGKECNYSVYQADNLLKGNMARLLEPPSGLRIFLPATRKAKRSRTSASFFHVQWDFEEVGYPCPFVVQFRPKGDLDWEEKMTKSDVYETEIMFRRGLIMEIRVAAKTVIGQSEFSAIIDTETASYVDVEMASRRKQSRFADQCMEIVIGSPLAAEEALQPPTELSVELVSRTTAKLQWRPLSDVDAIRPFIYVVQYCRNGQDSSLTEELDVPSEKDSCLLENLLPETTYSISIVAVSVLGEETSLPSESVLLTTGKEVGFPETVFKQFKKIRNTYTHLDLHSIPLARATERSSTLDRYVFGEPGWKEHKTILVMGASESGKTMLINALINYIFNVEWDDPFRFQLVEEHPDSVTTCITAYDIHHMDGFRIPYSLTIVSVTGYGNPQNISRNRKINASVRLQMLRDGADCIQEVDMVVFVAHASLPGPAVVRMFDLVRSVFGDDIKENVSYFFTFADSQVPPMLSAIRGSGLPCPCDAVTGQPLYYKFDSSAFFGWNRKSLPGGSSSQGLNNNEDHRNVQLNRLLMSMGMENFQRFFAVLSTLKTKLYRR